MSDDVRTCTTTVRTAAATAARSVPVGTREVTTRGYVRVKTERGWQYEHRMVAAEILGAPLAPGQRVRWRNGNRSDNRPANLYITVEQPFPRPRRKPSPRPYRVSVDLGLDLHARVITWMEHTGADMTSTVRGLVELGLACADATLAAEYPPDDGV